MKIKVTTLALSLALVLPTTGQSEEITATDKWTEGWLPNLIQPAAENRLGALENAWNLTISDNEDNFRDYTIGRGRNRNIRGRNVFRNSRRSAEALAREMQENYLIDDQFDVVVVDSGLIAASMALPFKYYTVKLTPKNEYGPSFIFDRYFHDRMYTVKREYMKGGETFHYDIERMKKPTDWFDEQREQIGDGTIDPDNDPEYEEEYDPLCDGEENGRRVWVNNSDRDNMCRVVAESTEDSPGTLFCDHLFLEMSDAIQYRVWLMDNIGEHMEQNYGIKWLGVLPAVRTIQEFATEDTNMHVFHNFFYMDPDHYDLLIDEGVCM